MEVFSGICKHKLNMIGIFVLSVLLSSCMLGPDYKPQETPKLISYTEKPLPSKTLGTKSAGKGGVTQVFVHGRDIPGEWWTLFKSKEINQLIEMGMKNNPDLAAAKASLTQARELYAAQRGNLLFPGVDLSLDGQRHKFAGSTFGGGVASNLFNLFNATVSVAYNLDVFGGNRRQIESYLAKADMKQFELLATYLTLTSNIVTTAITISSYESQIAATKKLIRSQEKQLKILFKQYKLGGIPKSDYLSQSTLVNNSKASLQPLQKSLSQSKHALSVLVGQFPDQPLPKVQLSKLTLPKNIPVSLPSKLVKQRPDIRAAEAMLHAANADVGAATAKLFPSFNLSANYGWSAQVLNKLFNPLTNTWLYGAAITQPVYHGGSELAYRRSVIAAYNAALAQYKKVLLQAFQNTADSLRALDYDARELNNTKSAELAARDALRINTQQYKLGGVSYLELLNAQSAYQQTKLASIQSQATRYIDTVALYASLGGGWWNNESVTCDERLNPTKASLKCP